MKKVYIICGHNAPGYIALKNQLSEMGYSTKRLSSVIAEPLKADLAIVVADRNGECKWHSAIKDLLTEQNITIISDTQFWTQAAQFEFKKTVSLKHRLQAFMYRAFTSPLKKGTYGEIT
ncbi:MAG: hypothetical protein ACRBFS_22985 [Aureispira sp.]